MRQLRCAQAAWQPPVRILVHVTAAHPEVLDFPSASACPKEASACADARRQPDLSSMGTLARAQDIRAQRTLPSVPRLKPLANPQVPKVNLLVLYDRMGKRALVML